MQVIILAAGRGSRMGKHIEGNHKSLLPINSNDSFLSHLLHQLNEYQLSKVVIVTGYLSYLIEEAVSSYQLNIVLVHNDRYNEDTNIYSMKLALDCLTADEPVVVFEADTYIDELALRRVMTTAEEDKSFWFTKEPFNSNQYGGILKSDESGKILDIQIVPQYEDKFLGYDKLLGIQSIGSNEFTLYKELVNKYLEITLAQYYLIPWIENLKDLPSYSKSLMGFTIESVNNYQEYLSFVKRLEEKTGQYDVDIHMLDVSSLLPIEDHISERAELLFEEISNSDFWIKPIVVEKNNQLILDGHHRFEVANKLGFKKIPAVYVNYDDVDVWSLRKNEYVDRPTVISRAKNKDIYPNKTVKHKFPFVIPLCKIKVTDLK